MPKQPHSKQLSPKHLSKEDRKRQLLNAAITEFGRRGYHQTQISDIIKRARVARGTFYLYFKAKREIFDAIMSELFERVRSEVRSLPRGAVREIPDQLKGNLERVTDLLLDNPLLARILFNESVGLDADLDRRLKKFYGQLLGLIQRGLEQGQEMGFVREGDRQVLSIALLGCMKEIFYQSILGTDTQQLTRPAIVREIFRLVIYAIARPEFRQGLETFL